jgi:ammonium transporter Rh
MDDQIKNPLIGDYDKYSMFQQIHVMIFIGFGYLMVFLKTFSWSAIGFTYIASAFAIEVYILFSGFWHGCFHHGDFSMIEISINSMITADFCAGAVMITFGVLLGKVTLA